MKTRAEGPIPVAIAFAAVVSSCTFSIRTGVPPTPSSLASWRIRAAAGVSCGGRVPIVSTHGSTKTSTAPTATNSGAATSHQRRPKRPGEQQQDGQRDRQADHLAEQRRPLSERPLEVALLLEPVAAAPPELHRAERQPGGPDSERRHRADHHAGRDAAQLPGARRSAAPSHTNSTSAARVTSVEATQSQRSKPS